MDKEIIELMIEQVADEHNLTINNKTFGKVVNAKDLFFKGGDIRKCPCDKDGERYCGGLKCLEEIKEKGVCHCNLFLRKE